MYHPFEKMTCAFATNSKCENKTI